MAFDPTKPVEDSPLDAAEIRNQLNALQDQITALQQQIAPALVLTLTGNTFTWSPHDPNAACWAVKIYDLSGNLLDDSSAIDANHASVNAGDLWDPPPFQVTIQAQDGDGNNYGPVSNKVVWRG